MSRQLAPDARIAPLAPILVVEDDPQVRDALRWLLEDEGLPVETVADGAFAVEFVARCRPSLVLLDIDLPVLNGYEVAAALADCGADRPPIVVVTADGRAAEKAERVGALAYLHKPFDVDGLIEIIRRALRRAERGRGRRDGLGSKHEADRLRRARGEDRSAGRDRRGAVGGPLRGRVRARPGRRPDRP